MIRISTLVSSAFAIVISLSRPSLIHGQANVYSAPETVLYGLHSARPLDLALFATVQTVADEADFVVKLFPDNDPMLIKVLVENRTGAALSINLTNGRHERLYETVRSARQNWGWWRLSISELPDGPYSLHIRAGKHQVTRSFLLQTRPPVVYAHSRAVSF